MKIDCEILQVGDNVLRQIAEPVDKINAEIRAQLDEMVQTLFDADGAGLAAPQVGISRRMFVMRMNKGERILKVINPVLYDFSADAVEMEEGCLSVLGRGGPVYADVSRPASVRMKWTDESGAAHDEFFDEMNARIVQHEFDHLDGILFIDRVSSLRRAMIMAKVKKAQG